jgi:hypothetical protein
MFRPVAPMGGSAPHAAPHAPARYAPPQVRTVASARPHVPVKLPALPRTPNIVSRVGKAFIPPQARRVAPSGHNTGAKVKPKPKKTIRTKHQMPGDVINPPTPTYVAGIESQLTALQGEISGLSGAIGSIGTQPGGTTAAAAPVPATGDTGSSGGGGYANAPYSVQGTGSSIPYGTIGIGAAVLGGGFFVWRWWEHKKVAETLHHHLSDHHREDHGAKKATHSEPEHREPERREHAA